MPVRSAWRTKTLQIAAAAGERMTTCRYLNGIESVALTLERIFIRLPESHLHCHPNVFAQGVARPPSVP